MIVDTNIVIDLFDGSAPLRVGEAIGLIRTHNQLVVNEVIFAELSGRFSSATALQELLDQLEILVARLTLDACHRAGMAFNAYRQAGGARTTILPDFLIGAQAAQNGWSLLTRDRKGFASYFPEVELIDPYKADHD